MEVVRAVAFCQCARGAGSLDLVLHMAGGREVVKVRWMIFELCWTLTLRLGDAGSFRG